MEFMKRRIIALESRAVHAKRHCSPLRACLHFFGRTRTQGKHTSVSDSALILASDSDPNSCLLLRLAPAPEHVRV